MSETRITDAFALRHGAPAVVTTPLTYANELYRPPAFPWYAIRVKAKSEKVAARALNGRGYEEFLPTYAVRSHWTDRVKTIEFPLFPGYVFCRLNVENRLPVLTIPGVMGIAGIGKAPLAISEQEILAIQAISQAGSPAAPWPYLQEGQRVRITQGSLRDLEGILITIKNGFRLVLSVTLLQRSVAVEVDRDAIQPL